MGYIKDYEKSLKGYVHMNTKLALTLSWLFLFALAACSDNDSSGHITYDVTTEETNANNTVQTSSSSAIPSSSSVLSLSSSSVELRFDMWNPEKGEYYVFTGLDNGTETSGYWYAFSDQADGGASYLEWPISHGGYDDNALDPIIEEFGGVYGTIKLDKGTLEQDPFAGLAFNVAGIEPGEETKAQATDASKWGGICFAYESQLEFRVEMELSESVNKQLKNDLPGVKLPPSAKDTMVCFAWSEFKQQNGNEMSGEKAAMQLASIRFTISGKDGTTGTINIKGIGSFNKVVNRESISSGQSSVIVTSASREFDMWNGASEENTKSNARMH